MHIYTCMSAHMSVNIDIHLCDINQVLVHVYIPSLFHIVHANVMHFFAGRALPHVKLHIETGSSFPPTHLQCERIPTPRSSHADARQLNKLKNPANDATLLKGALVTHGFQVTLERF